MSQKEFKNIMQASKTIVDRLTKELVELRLSQNPDKDLIQSKEQELKQTVETVAKNYLYYYGIK